MLLELIFAVYTHSLDLENWSETRLLGCETIRICPSDLGTDVFSFSRTFDHLHFIRHFGYVLTGVLYGLKNKILQYWLV